MKAPRATRAGDAPTLMTRRGALGRVRPALWLAALLMAGIVPLAGGSAGADCGAGVDSTASAPVAVTAPELCSATMGGSDLSDRYLVHADAGGYLRVKTSLSFVLAATSPSGAITKTGVGRILTDVAETGNWRIDVQDPPDDAMAYTLQVTTQRALHAGHVVLAHPLSAHGVGGTRALGPGAPEVDGAWYRLPGESTGKEWVELTFARTVPADLDVRFFDGAVAEIEAGCATDSFGLSEQCVAPAGTHHALVTGRAGAVVEHTLIYHHS